MHTAQLVHGKNAIAALCVILTTVLAQDFGYDGSEGPGHWGEKYQHCQGKHQSPIDIEEHDVEVVNLYPLKFENFNVPPLSVDLINNGHTVQMTAKTDKKASVSGGPLVGKYEFAQLHFHWGTNDGEGSETRINNNSYPMELHMVFYRSAYGSMQNATEHPDGLTVLSFLYSTSPIRNQKYDVLIKGILNVEEENSTTTIAKFPAFDDFLVPNRSVYFTYGGSLTTPPCSEVVTWIEFKNTIELSHGQIDAFRHLRNQHGQMTHNFRPVQPIYGRIIRMNQGTLQPIEKPHKHAKRRRNSAIVASANTLTLIFVYICVHILK